MNVHIFSVFVANTAMRSASHISSHFYQRKLISRRMFRAKTHLFSVASIAPHPIPFSRIPISTDLANACVLYAHLARLRSVAPHTQRVPFAFRTDVVAVLGCGRVAFTSLPLRRRFGIANFRSPKWLCANMGCTICTIAMRDSANKRSTQSMPFGIGLTWLTRKRAARRKKNPHLKWVGIRIKQWTHCALQR